jgi:hypothetical protein
MTHKPALGYAKLEALLALAFAAAAVGTWHQAQRQALPTARVDVKLSPAAHGGSQWCVTLAPPTRGQPPWAARCWYG